MATFNVSTTSQLSKALSDVRSGDTIQLEGGNYGALDLNSQRQSNLRADKTITITSADPDDPAIFDGLTVRNASNLALEGLKFDFKTDASTSVSAIPFRVDQSSDIAIRDSSFTGDDYKGSDASLAGYGAGFGLRIIRSENVTLEGSDFSGFRVATSFSSSQGLTVRNNDYTDISGDALKFASIQGALIEGNRVGDFRTNPGDTFHRDMIQFLTSGTDTPSSDIVIRDNVLHSGAGPFTQSIFMGNEMVAFGRAGREMFYRDILIEDNVIYNAQAHGITIGSTDGLTIRNNTVLHNTAAGDHKSVHIPKINVSSDSLRVSITDNITDSIGGSPQAAWKISGNLFVQRTDVLGDGYYNDLFVAANRPDAPLEALQALPGGLVERLNVGADMTRFDPTPDSLTALARAAQDGNTKIFDAGLSADPSGLLGNKAVYRWDFGDGNTGTGMVVRHTYDSPGDYEVVLTATRGGQSDSFTFTAQSADLTLLSLRFGAAGRPDDTSSYDIPTEILGRAAPQENGSFHLADGNYISIERDVSTHLHALDEFTLSFSLQRDGITAGTGRIMQIKSSWGVEMDSSGRLVFEVTNNAGKTFKLTSDTAITDTRWHDVRITYDADDGVASMHIDGAENGSIAISGATQAYGGYGMMLGWPWGSNFNGKLRAVDIVAEADTDSSLPVREPDSSPIKEPGNGASAPVAQDLAVNEIFTFIKAGDYKALADSQSKDLVTGTERGGDGVILADTDGRFNAASAREGENILIGGGEDNWIVDGSGDNIMFGGGGADDFRFRGGDVNGTERDAILDFTDGDRLVLGGYDAGTFEIASDASGLRVFSGGAAMSATSWDQIVAVADASDAIRIADLSDGDGQLLSIQQNDGLHLVGFYDL